MVVPGPGARVDVHARSSDCGSAHTRSIVRALVRFIVPWALLLAIVARSSDGAAARHQTTPSLLQVITPGVRATVPAHPDVNVVARFVTGADGSVLADASALRAHLDGRDISSRFTPLVESGREVGVRAIVPHGAIRVGHRWNRLRISVHGRQVDPTGRTERQIVRVRFRTEAVADRTPVATIVADSLLLRAGVPVHFDASDSSDPELDPLAYQWDFGDGSPPSRDVAPVHTYADADASRTVRLTVDDGQLSATASVTLLACALPAGRSPGTLVLGADAPLEFGPVIPGARASRSFDVRNTSSDPNSWLAVCLAVEGDAFSVSPTRLDLRSGEQGTITLTFSPSVQGHAAATVALAASADNRAFVAVLAHGYGGTGGGSGPTLAAGPVFYAAAAPGLGGTAVGELRADGTPVTPDIGVHACAVPGGGAGTGDACLADSDCASNGGTCPQTSTCASGGASCAVPADCPDGSCSSFQLFDAAEFCGEGGGGLYLLSNDGVFTDPAPSDTDAERSEGVLGVTLDAGGNTAGHAILDRTTSGTNHLACDDIGAAAGGHVYLAEYHQVPDSGNCFRSEEESLVAVSKRDGGTSTLMPRIDAAEGLSGCTDDLDATTHLEASSDGMRFYASFESGGLWRLSPTPLQFLDQSYQESVFRLHPDGSVIFATVVDGATTTKVSVFKVSPGQVVAQPFAEDAVTACASFQVPGNRGAAQAAPASVLAGLAVSPSSDGSPDHAVVLVSVMTGSLADAGADPTSRQRADNLSARATIAFAAPSGATGCSPLGIVDLERLDQLTF